MYNYTCVVSGEIVRNKQPCNRKFDLQRFLHNCVPMS